MQLIRKEYQILQFDVRNNYDAILYIKENYADYVFRCCYIPCFDLYDSNSVIPKVGDYINGYICIKYAFPDKHIPILYELLLGEYRKDSVSERIYARGLVKEILSPYEIIISLNDLGNVLVKYEEISFYNIDEECLVYGELHLDTIDESGHFD